MNKLDKQVFKFENKNEVIVDNEAEIKWVYGNSII